MPRQPLSNVQLYLLNKCIRQLHLDLFELLGSRDPTGNRERDEIKRRKLEGKAKAKQ